MKQKNDLMLSDVAEMINTFYLEAEKDGTTNAIINVIEKAYNAGVEHGKAKS